jgi:hypothetical protein
MNKIVSTCVKTLVHFKNFALQYSRVGTGAASNFLPGAGFATLQLTTTGFAKF